MTTAGQDTDPRAARLPKWARDRLWKLERDLEHAHAKLAAGPGNSDTFADPHSDTPRPLGTGTLVRFGGDQHEDTFDVSYSDGQLAIRANTFRSDDLVIIPQSTNMVRAALVNREATRGG